MELIQYCLNVYLYTINLLNVLEFCQAVDIQFIYAVTFDYLFILFLNLLKGSVLKYNLTNFLYGSRSELLYKLFFVFQPVAHTRTHSVSLGCNRLLLNFCLLGSTI